MLRAFNISLLSVAATLSTSAAAFDFSAADALFARRGESPAVAAEAKAAYHAAIPQVAGEELIYAAEKWSRLNYLAMLQTTSTDAIKAAAQAGLKQIEVITPSAVGPSPQYFYWKAVYLSLFAKANGVLASLSRSKELLETLDAGRKVDANYEGGGFDRLSAIAYAKLPAFNPVGPSGDKALAKELFERSINSPAYSKEAAEHIATESGDYFYSVYGYYAELLAETGHVDEAKELLTRAIERIEQENDVPTKRVPETQIDLVTLKTILAKL